MLITGNFKEAISGFSVPHLVELVKDLQAELESRNFQREAQDLAIVHDRLCERYFGHRARQQS